MSSGPRSAELLLRAHRPLLWASRTAHDNLREWQRAKAAGRRWLAARLRAQGYALALSCRALRWYAGIAQRAFDLETKLLEGRNEDV